jgi:hypothetical protein
MLTYLSLFVGLVSAILGTFIKPVRQLPHGRQAVRPVAVLFVVLPVITFSIAAVQTYRKDQESDNLQSKLNSVENTLSASIDRVDAFEFQLTYGFGLDDAGFDPSIKNRIRQVMNIYSVITQSADGKVHYGVAKDMYGADASDDEQHMLKSIDDTLQRIREVQPAVLLISRLPPPGSPPLRDVVRHQIAMGFVQPSIDLDKLPKNIARYRLPNPLLIPSFRPTEIADSGESWFIPDKNSESPQLELTWRFRLYANSAAELRLLRDYQKANVVLFAPRQHPNLDSSPSLGAFTGKPFGHLLSARMQVAGMEFSWKEGEGSDDGKLMAPPRNGQAAVFVGQLVELQQKAQ